MHAGGQVVSYTTEIGSEEGNGAEFQMQALAAGTSGGTSRRGYGAVQAGWDGTCVRGRRGGACRHNLIKQEAIRGDAGRQDCC